MSKYDRPQFKSKVSPVNNGKSSRNGKEYSVQFIDTTTNTVVKTETVFGNYKRVSAKAKQEAKTLVA